MNRPRLLDLFSGAGGAGVGYARAGFDVVGVDILAQPRYPMEFHQGDALGFVEAHGHEFDAIHASPPCQAYSTASGYMRNRGKLYPDLLSATRDALEATGKPWVIENVPGAPMRPDLIICGCQVGLPLRRRRWFETSWRAFTLLPPHEHDGPVVCVVGRGAPSWCREQLGRYPDVAEMSAAMGIDWMRRDDLSLAIPPAYTQLVGAELLAELASRTAVA